MKYRTRTYYTDAHNGRQVPSDRVLRLNRPEGVELFLGAVELIAVTTTDGEEAFLHAEACELAILSKEEVSYATAQRKPKSVLHTLSVELAVLMGLDDRERLVGEATRLLAREGREDAITVLHDASSKQLALSQTSH